VRWMMPEETRRIMLSAKPVSDSHRDLSRRWKAFAAGLLVLFLLVVSVLYLMLPHEPDWSVTPAGLVNYGGERGHVVYSEENLGGADTLIKVEYESRGATVYGILRIPKSASGGKAPGIVLLPGAGVTKENGQKVAVLLANMGYATLTIDQRGVGESREAVGDLRRNYEYFLHGNEPPLHKMLYDALRAYDLLKERPEIDSGRILVAGESMGGRIAIMAGAVEPGIRGVVGISTGGYGLGQAVPMDNQTLFQRSVDPDAYVGLIAPRKLLMLHSKRDRMVSLENAERTFGLAGEPKRIVAVGCETHGYCADMEEGLREGLAWIYG
jgi:uncharacterized protein